MSQRIWIILVVAAVVVFGFLFWPAGTNDAAFEPTGEPEAAEPAEEPTTE